MTSPCETTYEQMLAEYSAARRQRLDEALGGFLRADGLRPHPLHQAMRYVVEGGGKRLRSMLCIAAAEACGGSLEEVLPAACALELIHSFSLVHDDLPALDDDAVRRGRPSCHIVYGEAMAILAGDALFARAFELLALQGRRSPWDRTLRVIEIIAGATSMDGMAAGQAEDLRAEGTAGDGETLEYIHSRKTMRLIQAAVMTGAVLVGADEALLARLASYGRALGLAFQIVDDLLGEVGDPSVLGKPIQRDRQRAKLTYPRVYGIPESRRIAEQKVEEALAAIAPLPAGSEPLRWIASQVMSRQV